jgi:hypothetical protein
MTESLRQPVLLDLGAGSLIYGGVPVTTRVSIPRSLRPGI